jgi:site-specific DNA-methyltransferase (adenine-specific)
MGSGTTAKVAYLMNRRWIGSEISKEYVDIAYERLKEYTSSNLFTTKIK